MPGYLCPDLTCIFSLRPVYSTKAFFTRHIRNKPIKTIVGIARQLNVCQSPETEDFGILAELIADKSKVMMN